MVGVCRVEGVFRMLEGSPAELWLALCCAAASVGAALIGAQAVLLGAGWGVSLLGTGICGLVLSGVFCLAGTGSLLGALRPKRAPGILVLFLLPVFLYSLAGFSAFGVIYLCMASGIIDLPPALFSWGMSWGFTHTLDSVQNRIFGAT